MSLPGQDKSCSCISVIRFVEEFLNMYNDLLHYNRLFVTMD